jgi:hypothetical protein
VQNSIYHVYPKAKLGRGDDFNSSAKIPHQVLFNVLVSAGTERLVEKSRTANSEHVELPLGFGSVGYLKTGRTLCCPIPARELKFGPKPILDIESGAAPQTLPQICADAWIALGPEKYGPDLEPEPPLLGKE